MAKKPLLSIVIPSYNSKATLGKCLKSVFASPFKDKEVIVVDDRSTDGSYEIAKKFPCKVIRLKRNSGPATARNKGAEKTKGKIILFLDSDVIVHRDTLQEAVKSFNEDIAAVSGMYAKRPANKGLVEDYYALLKYYARIRVNKKNYDIFEAACGAIRRDIFLKMKGFNETYKGAETENEEFAHRLIKTYRMILNKNMQVTHHSPNIQSLMKNFRRRAYLWAKLFMKRKHFESSLTTPTVGVANLAGFASIFLLVLSILHLLFFILFIMAIAVFLIGYGSYFLYFLKEKGLLFMLAAIAITYILSLSVSTGALLGFFDYIVLGQRGVTS